LNGADPRLWAVDLRVEVRPAWAYRLPLRRGRDGLLRVRGRVVQRLVHVEGAPAVVRVCQLAKDRVLFGAQADGHDVAEEAIARMRFALCVDDDLRDFHDRFRHDPLIGPVVRAKPWLRVERRPEPFEALAWAVTEQLIESERAEQIQRRLVWRHGRQCARTGLRDAPTAEALSRLSPPELQSADLSAARSIALVKVAREVARGRVDLRDGDHERGWRRLLAISGIGPWTVECLALHGQGRHDQLPAGDLAYLKLVGRWRAGGRPSARATIEEVRELFSRYDPWAGLAGAYALRSPVLAGTRSSAPAPRLAA
jgi:3-methyladenine DNA glycosylase/8-oxoguanine DNA glycosylase